MNNYQETLYNLLGEYALPALETLAVLIAGAVLYSLITHAIGKLAVRGLIAYQLNLTLNRITRWLMAIVVLLVVLGLFGVSVTTFWAALSGVLVLVALGFVAVWSVLSNVLCSVLLVIFAPFRIGDEVELMDTVSTVRLRGKVVDINMFFTTLESVSTEESSEHERNTIMRVPNNQFFQKYLRRWPGEETSSLKHYLADEYKRNRE